MPPALPSLPAALCQREVHVQSTDKAHTSFERPIEVDRTASHCHLGALGSLEANACKDLNYLRLSNDPLVEDSLQRLVL